MLVWYKYRNDHIGTQGWFQCDSDDFKAMFRNPIWRRETYWCQVKHPDGRLLMWTKQTGWFEPKHHRTEDPFQ